MADEIGPDFRYRVGFEDGLQEGINLAERLRDAWREAGSGNGLVRGAAIIAFLLKKRKEEDGILTRGESGTNAPGSEAGVGKRLLPRDVDQGILEVAHGSPSGAESADRTAHQRPTPEERLERIREILNQAEPADSFHLNGYPSQYAALADLYDEDFASALREAVGDA